MSVNRHLWLALWMAHFINCFVPVRNKRIKVCVCAYVTFQEISFVSHIELKCILAIASQPVC